MEEGGRWERKKKEKKRGEVDFRSRVLWIGSRVVKFLGFTLFERKFWGVDLACIS